MFPVKEFHFMRINNHFISLSLALKQRLRVTQKLMVYCIVSIQQYKEYDEDSYSILLLPRFSILTTTVTLCFFWWLYQNHEDGTNLAGDPVQRHVVEEFSWGRLFVGERLLRISMKRSKIHCALRKNQQEFYNKNAIKCLARLGGNICLGVR